MKNQYGNNQKQDGIQNRNGNSNDGMNVQYNNLMPKSQNNRDASQEQAEAALSSLITQLPQGQDKPLVAPPGVSIYVKIKQSNNNYQMYQAPPPEKIQNQQQFQNAGINQKGVLGHQSERSLHKKTLVLDLDETLVHSSFKVPQEECIVLPVEIDDKKFKVYVLVRPNAEKFLKIMQIYYEVIIYTASLSKYADPLMDILDSEKSVSARLFREHCTFYQGMYVKDLSELGRDLRDVIIVDNSPTAYLFQPDNALPISSWYDDKDDRSLFDYIPFLIELSKVDDVRPILKQLNQVSLENDVNLEYGMQLISNSYNNLKGPQKQAQNVQQQEMQYQKNGKFSDDQYQKNIDQQNLKNRAVSDDDEISQIENFEDSLRQEEQNIQNQSNRKQFTNKQFQNIHQDSQAVSERSTPLLTIPDTEIDSFEKQNWPLHLGSYNREKKLIRDVSCKSEKYQKLQQSQPNHSNYLKSSYNQQFGSGTPSNLKQQFNNTAKLQFNNYMANNGPGTYNTAKNNLYAKTNYQNSSDKKNELSKSAQKQYPSSQHKLVNSQMNSLNDRTFRAVQGKQSQMKNKSNESKMQQTKNKAPMLNKTGRVKQSLTQFQQTSSSANSMDKVNKQPPRQSYRVGVMTSTSQNHYDNREQYAIKQKNDQNFQSFKSQEFKKNQIQNQIGQRLVSTPNQVDQNRLKKNIQQDHENDKNSIKTAGSINRTPKSTIASPGRIMQPNITSTSQQVRSVSYEITQGIVPQQNTFMSNFGSYANFFGNSKKTENNKQSALNESSDPSIEKHREPQQNQQNNLAQSRSLFGKGKRAMNSLRFEQQSLDKQQIFNKTQLVPQQQDRMQSFNNTNLNTNRVQITSINVSASTDLKNKSVNSTKNQQLQQKQQYLMQQSYNMTLQQKNGNGLNQKQKFNQFTNIMNYSNQQRNIPGLKQ